VSVWNRASADGLGTALLLAAVVGSGIMGERLSQGNDAIALLANSLATGFALAALIITFGPRSGAHFNPVVTVALAIRRDIPWRDVGPYLTLQFTGALIGVAAAHMMFDLPIIQYSIKARSSWGLWWSEIVATFGLVLVVLSCDAKRPWAAPVAVAGYIAAAYWFTASTSFANPAVTLARGFTNTFAGIDLGHTLPFMAAQVVGAGLAVGFDRGARSDS
jgi:glycerol uptake facilitator-like aquaporin